MSKILNQHPSNNFFQIAGSSRKNPLRLVLFLITIPFALLFLLRSFDFQRDEKILAQENKIMQDEYVGVLQAPEYRETEYSLKGQNFSCRSV